jgi:receptor expression-enhancing protein 5/6
MSVSQDKQKSFSEIFALQLEIIEKNTGVNPKYFSLAIGVALAFVLIGYFEFYIVNVVGILYPAIWSIKAIESKDADDDKQWLTYWVVFAVFTFIDLFSGFILRFIPFYFFVKLLFLIWCFMPNTRGATFIYNHFIIKFYRKYERFFDRLETQFATGIDKVVEEGRKVANNNQDKILLGAASLITEKKSE